MWSEYAMFIGFGEKGGLLLFWAGLRKFCR